MLQGPGQVVPSLPQPSTLTSLLLATACSQMTSLKLLSVKESSLTQCFIVYPGAAHVQQLFSGAR